MKRRWICLATLLLFGLLREATALVIPYNEGRWPTTWPKELETLRETSQTLVMATGMQEHIYTIPFENREQFEKLLPILMKVRTPGSPVTLSKVGKIERGWGDLLSNSKPAIRIKGPTGGYLGGTINVGGQIDRKKLDDGTMLFAGTPWPAYLNGPLGELPEFVVSVKSGDGKYKWVPSEQLDKGQVGFLHRARIDLEFVVDGDIIDLNRIPLPPDAKIIDRRFVEIISTK